MADSSIEIVGQDGDAISLNEGMLRSLPSFVKTEDDGYEGVILSAAIPDDLREGGTSLRVFGADGRAVDLPLDEILEAGMLAYAKDRRPLRQFRIHIPKTASCGADIFDRCAKVAGVVRIEVT